MKGKPDQVTIDVMANGYMVKVGNPNTLSSAKYFVFQSFEAMTNWLGATLKLPNQGIDE